ncbi:45_t:CDS:10, partial [Diversispora eburnea]
MLDATWNIISTNSDLTTSNMDNMETNKTNKQIPSNISPPRRKRTRDEYVAILKMPANGIATRLRSSRRGRPPKRTHNNKRRRDLKFYQESAAPISKVEFDPPKPLSGEGTVNGDGTINGGINGTTINETTINGTKINGTKINGTKINGTKINGTIINGTIINGISNAPSYKPRAIILADWGIALRKKFLCQYLLHGKDFLKISTNLNKTHKQVVEFYYLIKHDGDFRRAKELRRDTVLHAEKVEELFEFVLKYNQNPKAWQGDKRRGRPQLVETVRTALNDFAKTKLGVSGDKAAPSKDDPLYLLYVQALRKSVDAIAVAEVALEDNDTSKESAHDLLENTYEIIISWLDKEKGASITDPKVFRDLAAHWEKDFMEDMRTLNVCPSDILTRVSEYVPEIVKYIQKIIDNGYAYETDNEKLIEEGEGSLGSKLQGKKNKSDFALWKKSKPGEPFWESPWVIGENLDIHSGGIDLAFPHHDNELAQSEAYHGCNQWVNYFIHAGHLNLEGQKMSKSLKNFITIKQALEKYTSRQLRFCFLLHQWDSKLDFKDSSLAEAKNIETILNNFFVNVKALINEHKHSAYLSDGTHQYLNPEKELLNVFRGKQQNVHAALCDSFNTPTVISEIMDLVYKTNIYIASGRSKININIIENIANYVTKMLRIFGVIESSESKEIGFGVSEKQKSVNKEEIVLPYLRVLSNYRDNIREYSRQKKDFSEFLKLSDNLRDVELIEFGVSLDDQEDGKALVKFVNKEELIKAREEKLKVQAEKLARKEEMAKAKEEERKKKLEQGKLAPEDMFKNVKGENEENAYSAFDEQGIPTHDSKGEELAKNRVKKLKKEWETQNKLHTEYLASLEQNNND